MSPKNKGKFGKAKVTTVKETDEFISAFDRLFHAVRPHAVRLAIFLGVIALIVLGFTTWKWWQNRQLTSATELYARAVELGQVAVRPPEPPAAARPGEKAPPAVPKKKPAMREHDPRNLPSEFASAEERARAVLAALDELGSDHDSSGVARQALLLEGQALHELGRYNEAAERYRRYADGGGPEALVVEAREGLAYSLEAQAMAEKEAKQREAGLEHTLKAFQEMQPKPEGLHHDEALYHQGRILAALGRTDQARKTFEQLLVDHPSSSLKESVEMRMPGLRAGAPATGAPATKAPATGAPATGAPAR